MTADNQFLIALINKLEEIKNNTGDVDTEMELDGLITSIVDSLR